MSCSFTLLVNVKKVLKGFGHTHLLEMSARNAGTQVADTLAASGQLLELRENGVCVLVVSSVFTVVNI